MTQYVYQVWLDKIERYRVKEIVGDRVYIQGLSGHATLGEDFFLTEEEAVAQDFKDCLEEVQSLREQLHDSLVEFRAIRKECPKTVEELRARLKRANY